MSGPSEVGGFSAMYVVIRQILIPHGGCGAEIPRTGGVRLGKPDDSQWTYGSSGACGIYTLGPVGTLPMR
jgi:hypothetical protein